jgi:hypothetical protein
MFKICRPRRLAKFQWLQGTSEVNGHNMNNVRYQTLQEQKETVIRIKINELETISKKRYLGTCIEE